MHRKIADASLLEHLPDEVGPRKMAFRGGAVHWRQPPGSKSFVSLGHSIVIMLAPSPGFSFGFDGEKLRTFNATQGMLAVRPAGLEGRASWSAPTKV